MHRPETHLENEGYKILCKFEINRSNNTRQKTRSTFDFFFFFCMVSLFNDISTFLGYLGRICLFRFHGMSTFVGYLMPNPFLYK